eukprot:PhF_6_TR38960/c0_g1_i1/m.58302
MNSSVPNTNFHTIVPPDGSLLHSVQMLLDRSNQMMQISHVTDLNIGPMKELIGVLARKIQLQDLELHRYGEEVRNTGQQVQMLKELCERQGKLLEAVPKMQREIEVLREQVKQRDSIVVAAPGGGGQPTTPGAVAPTNSFRKAPSAPAPKAPAKGVPKAIPADSGGGDAPSPRRHHNNNTSNTAAQPAGGGGGKASVGFRTDEGTPKGLTVTAVVPGSPADRAHILNGDVISRFHNVEVRSRQELADILVKCNPGEVVEVVFSRGGAPPKTVRLTLGTK